MMWSNWRTKIRKRKGNTFQDDDEGRLEQTIPLVAVSPSSKKNGDGRSIHIDAPIVRRIKQSSRYTKLSYVWLISSILVTYYGFRSCYTNQSFTKLRCNKEEGCTLQDKGPSSSGHPDYMITTTFIPNHRLIKTEFVCVSRAERVILQRYGSSSPATNHSPVYGCFKQGGVYSYTLLFDMTIEDYEYFITHPLGHPFHFREDMKSTVTDISDTTSTSNKTTIETTYVMRKYNLSKQQNREQYYRLGSYLHDLLNEIEIKHKQFFTKGGLSMMLLGMISITFWSLFGQLRDPSFADKTQPSYPGDHTKRVRQLQERQRRRLNQ